MRHQTAAAPVSIARTMKIPGFTALRFVRRLLWHGFANRASASRSNGSRTVRRRSHGLKTVENPCHDTPPGVAPQHREGVDGKHGAAESGVLALRNTGTHPSRNRYPHSGQTSDSFRVRSYTHFMLYVWHRASIAQIFEYHYCQC